MAGGTVYRSVFSFQFEGRFIVVEFDRIPVVEGVAAGTIRDAVFVKLTAVNIFVTGRTSRRHIGKLLKALRQMSFIVFFAVAGHTRLFGVGARQFELGYIMVEMVRLPALRDVALRAGLVGIEFFIQEPFVYVFMAICAGFSYFSELPFFTRIRLVAGKTGCGQVTAF